MDQSSKEPKRGTIRSFIESCNTKNRKSTSEIPHNTTDSLSHEKANTSSTSANDEQQEEQISTYSSSLSHRLFASSSNSSSSLNKPEENISSTLSESSTLLSPSSKRRQEQISSSSLKSPRLSSPPSRVSQLSSPSSSGEQQEKASSLSSSAAISNSPIERLQDQVESCSFECSSSSNKPSLNPSDLSGSFNEPPRQPKLPTYPMNKDKRCFRIQWFSQYCWLEYSILTDCVFCYYCRHFNSGTHLNSRNQSDAYVRGFNSWKNAFSKLSSDMICNLMRAFIFTTNNANAVHLVNLFRTANVPYMISDDIRQLTSDYDILIVPGGTAGLYQKHLSERGIASIRDFVANGGGYLGLCAGAYLASTNDITDTKNIGIDLLPVRYSLYGRGANIRANVTLNDARTNVVYQTTYHNGAVYQFDQLSSNVTVLATITDTDSSNSKFHQFLVNKATIIAGIFGKGHVVLCGPHIEVNMKSYMFSLITEVMRQPEVTTSTDLSTS